MHQKNNAPSKNTAALGKKGEDFAAAELEKRGISIIGRNFRSSVGEIDLIGLQNDTIVFIEVKSWTAYSIDSLEHSLNKKKQQRIIETAKYFLQKHREYSGMVIRFDVIFIGQRATIDHIMDAWTESV